MNVTFDVGSNCHLAVDVPDVKQAFQFIAYAESVFGVDRCGNCESSNLQLLHRQPQGYDYYSVQCKDCHHELKFGQVKESGRLFQKGWEPPYSDDSDDGGSGESGNDQSSHSESESQEPAHAGKSPPW